MLFNSIEFVAFLIFVFILYWRIKTNKIQNILLLFASYYFYSIWDYRFLFLLLFSTFIDFYSGIKIEKGENKKIWLWSSVTINIGLLAAFKYYNFFLCNFVNLLSELGIKTQPTLLSIVLPVGISFYTFHGLSYIIDIYNGKIKSESNFIDYALFVSFFPLLVAGPIERATHLLPQIKKNRYFVYDKAADGLRQILWGFFKKIVIADQCAKFANIAFESSSHYSGSTYLLGLFYFTIQIYCDFSGYSDIALGTARLLGIELLKNFSFPYFSRDIAEFWRRWHISLSTWFKDYLYIPLGGSKGNQYSRIRNTLIIFLISGFWHGANWTFVVWGLLNALYIMPSILFKTNRNNITIVSEGSFLPSFKDFLSILITFCLTMFAWIFFRAENIRDAFHYISNIFSTSIFSKPQLDTKLLFVIGFFFLVEWIGRDKNYAIEKLFFNKPIMIRWLFYFLILISIMLYANKGGNEQFIYFQF